MNDNEENTIVPMNDGINDDSQNNQMRNNFYKAFDENI